MVANDAGLAGQTALVTGAGSGIGRAIALALAAEGMRVVLVGRRVEPLHATAVQAGEAAVVLAADISSPEGRNCVASSAPERLGVLVHSAGAFRHGTLADTDLADWVELATLNLVAPMLLTAALRAPLCAGAGQIVFINSTAGLRASAGAGAYGASKHALRAAADVLRQEVNKDGIRVLSVFPGRTDTPMQADVLAAEGRAAPAGTLMRASDVARMVVAALKLGADVEVTDITLRPIRPM